MKCPECNGAKIVLVPRENAVAVAVGCSTCEGAGEIPDPPQFPDNCLSCGAPIPQGQKWCDFHRAADLLGG